MALSDDKYLTQTNPAKQTIKKFQADATTYYVGELVMVGPASNTAKPISASSESGVQVVGYIAEKQVIAAAGDYLTVIQGPLVMTGSGFTQNEVNKLTFASDSNTFYDAWSEGRHKIGRFLGFTTEAGATYNAVFDIGNVVSGATF